MKWPGENTNEGSRSRLLDLRSQNARSGHSNAESSASSGDFRNKLVVMMVFALISDPAGSNGLGRKKPAWLYVAQESFA